MHRTPRTRARPEPADRIRLSPAASSLTAWYERTAGTVLNYPLLLLVTGCQLLTLAISWPVWNVREAPVLLPLVPLLEVSFGVPLVLTLLLVIPWPRFGVIAHAIVLCLAICADQQRMQPQVISLAVLMAGCLLPSTANLTRWYLCAMWLWAGLHKFFSPEWFGYHSWWFLEECGLDGDAWYWPFAIFVATYEVALGILAIFRPKQAAWPAVILHVGLLLSLSPLGRNFNVSVWPWNVATAVSAFWLLRANFAEMTREANIWLQRAAAAAMLLAPTLFYVDMLNPHLAFVLYSGNMPRAIHVRADSYSHLDGWTGFMVPFPDSPRLFLQQFRLTATPGERLHIQDPRPGLPDRYFVMQASQKLQEVDRVAYWNVADSTTGAATRPLELEDVQLVWRLKHAGYQLKPEGFEMIDAATNGTNQTGRQVPHHDIAGLHNLRELHWHQLTLDDRLLAALVALPRLELLELNNCRLPDNASAQLASMKSLRWLQIEHGKLPRKDFRTLVNLPQLQVLRLGHTDCDDALLRELEPTSQLTWLDLSHTPITSAAVRNLPPLPECDWLDLSGTLIDETALDNLPHWPKLEVLDLRNTNLTDRALPILTRLNRLQKLVVTGANLTPAGKAELQRALPNVSLVD